MCQQVAPRITDLQANRRLSLSAIADAAAAGADVIVLPELVTSGYVFESAEEAAAVAIAPDHALFEQWAAEAAGAVVVGGFAERGDDGLVYNSAAVVDQSGVIGVYRKVHLWDREKLWFAPAASRRGCSDTRRAGSACSSATTSSSRDGTHAGAGRGGAHLRAHHWPYAVRPEGERPPEVTIGMAAARVNRVFIACCDRTGIERGQH